MSTAERLTTRQRRAVRTLLTEPSVTAAAAAANVGESSLRRWLADDEAFRDAVREQERELWSAARRALSARAAAAVEALANIAEDEGQPASSRVQAAKVILDQLHRLQEDDLAERQRDPRPPTADELRSELPGLTEGEAEELAALVARPIEGLDNFELHRLMFLWRAVGPSEPDAPVTELGDECGGGFSEYSTRACFREHLGDPTPGIDTPAAAEELLTEGERARLDEISTDNPDVDIREVFRRAMASRDGKVSEQLTFRATAGCGTRHLQWIVDRAWHRFRTGGKPAAACQI